ncbi:hypothetical protein BGZ75_000780 [Mortierella antarctica]|nr:hypothetical protein BGZ75_000780 [Mortierella antarctica]
MSSYVKMFGEATEQFAITLTIDELINPIPKCIEVAKGFAVVVVKANGTNDVHTVAVDRIAAEDCVVEVEDLLELYIYIFSGFGVSLSLNMSLFKQQSSPQLMVVLGVESLRKRRGGRGPNGV